MLMTGNNGDILREFVQLILAEEVNLPIKRWVVVSLEKLSDEQMEQLFSLYLTSYDKAFGGVGLHPRIKEESDLARYKLTWLVDEDGDNYPDAFIMFKETNFGNKIVLVGSDGTGAAKHALISQTVDLLKQSGWFVEASGKLADILRSHQIKQVKDPDIILSILGTKYGEINVGEQGEYSRKIANQLMASKYIFGNPLV